MSVIIKEKTKVRYGSVVVFNSGVTITAAQVALESIQHLLDHPPMVNEFDPEMGGPVWYVP